MSKREFILQNSTLALEDSKGAVHLIEQKERLERAVMSGDAPLTLDTAKSLLESIFKTVLKDKVEDANIEQNFGPLFKSVKELIPFNKDAVANKLLTNLGSAIVHNVGELRNKFGAASHGDDGYFDTPIQMNDAEMIAHLVDGLAGFVYRKHKNQDNPELAQRIYYSDFPEFNNYLDGQYSGFQLDLGGSGGINVPLSEILFQSDQPYYREMLLQFRGTEEFDDIESEETIHSSIPIEDNEKVSNNLPDSNVGSLDHDISVNETDLEDNDLVVGFHTTIADTPDEAFIGSILHFMSPDMNEPTRQRITRLVSEKLVDSLTVDWEKRDSVQAGARNSVRSILRRYGFPVEKRDAFINEIFSSVI